MNKNEMVRKKILRYATNRGVKVFFGGEEVLEKFSKRNNISYTKEVYGTSWENEIYINSVKCDIPEIEISTLVHELAHFHSFRGELLVHNMKFFEAEFELFKYFGVPKPVVENEKLWIREYYPRSYKKIINRGW